MSISQYSKITASDINDIASWDVGSVKWVAYSATSAQTRALVCNGQTVSRTTYSDLFAKIGTTYGSGDGSTTFNLPDLITDNRYIQSTSSPDSTKYTADLPSCVGTWYTLSGNSSGTGTGVISGTLQDSYYAARGSYYGFKGGTYTFTASSGNAIYSGTTVQLSSLRLVPMIRY